MSKSIKIHLASGSKPLGSQKGSHSSQSDRHYKLKFFLNDSVKIETIRTLHQS